MGSMTVAFVALALLALALLVVPRVQRARRGRVRRPRFAAARRTPRAAVAMAAAGATPPSTRWHGSGASHAAEPADELDDLWDDDLGWGEPEPPAREPRPDE